MTSVSDCAHFFIKFFQWIKIFAKKNKFIKSAGSSRVGLPVIVIFEHEINLSISVQSKDVGRDDHFLSHDFFNFKPSKQCRGVTRSVFYHLVKMHFGISRISCCISSIPDFLDM
jgi:hypothetical protein